MFPRSGVERVMTLYGPEARLVQSGGRDEVHKSACMGGLHEHKGGVAGPYLTSTASPSLIPLSLLPSTRPSSLPRSPQSQVRRGGVDVMMI